MDVTNGRICHVATIGPRNSTVVQSNKKAPQAGLSQCAREDSNLHGPYSPQGPQPCASTNSATGAGGRSIGRVDSVGGGRYLTNTCSSGSLPNPDRGGCERWTSPSASRRSLTSSSAIRPGT